jgi:hypothetical protein
VCVCVRACACLCTTTAKQEEAQIPAHIQEQFDKIDDFKEKEKLFRTLFGKGEYAPSVLARVIDKVFTGGQKNYIWDHAYNVC